MNPACLFLMLLLFGQTDFEKSPGKWGQLTPLPDPQGFGGMYAGQSGDSLIVAGGTNFPNGFPWEGGKKFWSDQIFVLDQPNGAWKLASAKLPRTLGYGVSVSWNNALICVGGSDDKQHYADVFAIRLVNGNVEFQNLPLLPEPCANMCGCLVGSRIFIAGGTSKPDATTAMKSFWSLDLAATSDKQRWQVLEAWPGPDRSHAVAAALNGDFYLFSGFRWTADASGKPSRLSPFQTDAYRYTPKSETEGTWKRLADLPRALGAAPSPALSVEPAEFYVIGGIDHSVDLPDRATHPGFSRDIHRYDAPTDTWQLVSQMPAGASRVTAPTAVWQNRYLIVSGERAPGRRSPDIFSIMIK